PEWLFHGDNEIRFRPADESDPIGYRVSRVRIVATLGNGAAPAVRGDEQPSLSDGDPSTGFTASRAARVLTFPIAACGQPAGLNVRVGAHMTGSLRVAARGLDGKLSAPRDIDASKLHEGWSFVPLDGLPAGGALRVTWDAGPDGSGMLSEVRVAASPAPQGRGRRLVVSTPLHGECVD